MGIFSWLTGGGNSTANSNTGSVGSVHQGASGPGGMTGGEAFQSGIISAAERREQLLADAAAAQQSGQDYSYNTDEFTGHNLGLGNEETVGKIREGLTSSEYGDFMQQLHGNNPQAMQQAFPFSSGNLAGVASNLIPGVGMAKSILGVLNKMGGGVKEGITNSGAYNKFIDMVTPNEKPATDMGTRISSMDQAELDKPERDMLDISGPSVATNITDIKKNKSNVTPKTINAQSSLNDYLNTIGTINQIADNAGGANTLPYNFTNTFNNLNPNALTSSQYLQGQNMINNLPENNSPVIPYSNVGIHNPALFNKGSF